MQKLALVSIISTISTTITVPALASSMTCNVAGGTNNGVVYTTVATSNGISVVAIPNRTIQTYYVDNTEPTASDPWTPTPPPPNPYNLSVTGDWCIDQTSGSFTGNIVYGNYKTQTNWTFPTVDGRQTFKDVNQAFSGTGTWGTNGGGFPTLTFSYLNTTLNGGGASVYVEQNPATCSNGITSLLGKVCTAFATTSRNWEGLAFLFTFNATKYSFTGQLTGTDTSGTGLTRNTATIIWSLVGTDPPAEVPVPATAWLFGSGLIGLASAARYRARKT